MLISGFLRFHVLHLNYENFKLYLQNTLNMLRTARVYFGVLHIKHLIMHFTYQVDPFVVGLQFFIMLVDVVVTVVDSVYYDSGFSRL